MGTPPHLSPQLSATTTPTPAGGGGGRRSSNDDEPVSDSPRSEAATAMAELAAGAVSSLLVVIRNEAVLLSGVRVDVQFIKEEMESMNSFLAHLARREPPSGEHDDQVRTWMNQVRLLAQDCNNCIDLYLYSGNPDIHRSKGILRRHLWWVYWSLRKLVAQHRAAVQLRQLKDRARDVGERRLRYGVEVPAMSAVEHSPSTKAAAAPDAVGDDEDDYEDQLVVATSTETGRHPGRRVVFEPLTLDDYVKAKLMEWVEGIPEGAIETLSIAIVAPGADKEVLALAHETLVAPNINYRCSIMVNIPAVHLDFLPLRPKEVLYYILRGLERAKDHTGEWEEEDLDPWQDYYKKCSIYRKKKRVLSKIKRKIENMRVYEKLDKIKGDIQTGQQKGDKQQLLQLKKKGVDKVDLHVLLKLLLQSQRDQTKDKEDMYKLPEWNDDIIMKIAKKLKEHMEADEKVKELQEQMGVEEKNKQKREEMNEDNEMEKGGEIDGDEHRKLRQSREKGEERDELHEKKKDGEGGVKEKEKEGEEHNEEKERKIEDDDEVDEEKSEEDEDEKDEEDDDEDIDDKENEEVDEEKSEEDDEKDEQEESEEYEEEDDEEEEEGGDDDEDPIHLHEAQYIQILREIFPKTGNKPLQTQQQDKSMAKQAIKAATTTLDEERIKQMIREAKQEVLRELQQGKYDKNQSSGEPDITPDKIQATDESASVPDQNKDDQFEEIEQMIEEIKQELKEQLKIKKIVDMIKIHLKEQCPLIILKVDGMMDGSRWEEIRKALSLLQCSADALIFTTESTQQAKGYCYPPREPIEYSPVGLYHYTVLGFTSQQKNQDNYNPQIFRDILEECKPYEFCMKIFTHVLYADPKRSNEELSKLLSTLQQTSQKSFDAIAKKMLMYSYNDLPKEYKSCLLYLAIFPKGQKIRRSTLIERWVTEGLTFTEDWPSSVRQANRCFDALIRRWLVYPADIGATGKVKSCVVGDPIHRFITMIARKQHIVETRLSHHLARHFSIFNDLRLRSSDRIDTFFQSLSRSSRVSLLKVLDLEGCQCFGGKNQRYIKDICSKMLLLKYLSLKGTDITQLPSEINYLRELEVLDIRETKVPENATVNVLLLKLKRLHAGHIDPSPSNFSTSVQIPHRIDKMVNIEVLSNVKTKHRDDFEDIGKLWQLRKLGVVIDDKRSHLGNFLKAISDLHECLRSLSVTITTTTCEDTPSMPELTDDIGSRLKHQPKILESLSISGSRHLFPLLTKDGNEKLTKVTLSSIPLNEDDLNVLANLPKLQCVKLRHISCTNGVIIFKKEKFNCLKYLLIEGSNLTNVTFIDGAARELEKITLSSTSIVSISGVDRLPKFEELKLKNGSSKGLLSSFHNAKQIAKLTLHGTLLEQDDLQILATTLNMRCLVLLEVSLGTNQNHITFNKDEFIWLSRLIVDCSAITKIVFTSGSAPKLEKIVWSSSTSIAGIKKLPTLKKSLCGIKNLPRLKELEFNGDVVPLEKAIRNNNNEPETSDQAKGDEHKNDNNEPETSDQAEDEQEDDDAARF